MEEIHKIDINNRKVQFQTRLEKAPAFDIKYINDSYLTLINLEENINKCLTNDTKTKIELGSYLNEIKEKYLYKFTRCNSFEEYCEKEIGISKQYAYQLIKIFNFTKSIDVDTLNYTLYSISQLQEIFYLTEEQLKQVDPTMTIKQIRDLKNMPKTIDELKQEHDKGCDCHSCKTQDKYKLTIHDFNIENTSYDVDYFNNFNKQDLAVIAWNLYEELNYYRKQRKIQNVK